MKHIGGKKILNKLFFIFQKKLSNILWKFTKYAMWDCIEKNIPKLKIQKIKIFLHLKIFQLKQ